MKDYAVFRDRFPIEAIDPHDSTQYNHWVLFEHLKHSSFTEWQTVRWALCKFCLVHRYGLFNERPISGLEVGRLLVGTQRYRAYHLIRSGLRQFIKKLKEAKYPFDETFPKTLNHLGFLYDIDSKLFESYYRKIKHGKGWEI